MLKHYFFTFCGLFIFLNVNAQLHEPYRFEQLSNLDLGIRSESILLQLDYQHIHRLNPENRFRMGYGIGLMHFRAFDNIPYNNSGEIEDINIGLDTFQVVSARISSLNIFLLLNYAPNQRIDFGLSLDLIGLSWGSNQKGLFSSGPGDLSVLGAEAEPQQFNSPLAVSGSWRSQFYLRYWMYSRWAIQTGLTYWVSAYQITEDINLNVNEYSKGLLYWKVGLSFRWGKQASSL